jgi:AcrR family transcriptional regulator
MSLGQLQHYFGSRETLIAFAMNLVSEQTTARIKDRISHLGADPHPRDVLRVLAVEMLSAEDPSGNPVGAAHLATALRSPQAREGIRAEMLQAHAAVEAVLRQAVAAGALPAGLDPRVETARLLALSGFAPMLEIGVYTRADALAALERHLDQLFS